MKPIVFIGSTSESRSVAELLAAKLEKKYKCLLWSQNVFEGGGNTLHSLIEKIRQCDHGVFVFSGDDVTVSRSTEYFAPRDNVVLEAGMSLAAIDPHRTHIVPVKPTGPAASPLKFPTDLLGFTLTPTYDPASATSMNDVVSAITNSISRGGIRKKSNFLQDKASIARLTVELIKQSSRHIILVGRDLSWANTYAAAISTAVKRGVSVEVFGQNPNGAPWQENVDLLVKTGAKVHLRDDDLKLRFTMVDFNDPMTSSFVITSKERTDSGVIAYRSEFHDAKSSPFFWKTLVQFYDVARPAITA